MWSTNWRRGGAALLLIAAVLVAWGAVGLQQGLNAGFTGGLYDTEYRVPGVYPGSVADRAGFKAGDRVISVEGVPIEDLGMESRWPRSLAPRIGQTHRFIVERNGAHVPIDVVYPPPFAAAVNNRIAAFVLGLAFLCFGLWAHFTVRSAPALALAQIGLAAGVSSFVELGPSLGLWPGVKSHIATAASVLMYMLLLRYFVTYPSPKKVSESRLATWVAIGIWVAVLAVLAAELAVHPALYYTTGTVVGPLTMAYGLLILVAVVHTAWTLPRAQLHASGMNLIVGGFVVAILWSAAAVFGVVRLPSWVTSLAIAAIPLTMALAVQRQARADGQASRLQ